MTHPFITFSKIEEGMVFRGRDSYWLKIMTLQVKTGKLLNAFPVDPHTTVVDATAGTFFHDAALVQPIIEELPIEAPAVVPLLKRART